MLDTPVDLIQIMHRKLGDEFVCDGDDMRRVLEREIMGVEAIANGSKF